MKIAISTEGDFVSAHFARCPHFTIVEIEDNKIIKREKIKNIGHQPENLPNFFSGMDVSRIIAGGINSQAMALFHEKRILASTGVFGKIDEIIKCLCDGSFREPESHRAPGINERYPNQINDEGRFTASHQD